MKKPINQTHSKSNDKTPTDIGSVCDTQVCTVTQTAPYQSDPLSVYRLLCEDKANSLLLESAEIDKKHLLKSLLLTDAAVKIVCHGNTVTFTALTDNGQAAINFAEQQLNQYASLTVTNNQLTAVFPEVTAELDEKSRLMAINPFQSLRLFSNIQPAHTSCIHPFSIFLGGVFAFDMMSMSEKLPDVPHGENTCPDFVYYLAETLIIIDHEKQCSEIIGNMFFNAKAPIKSIETQQKIEARVNNIAQVLASEIHCTKVTSTAEQAKLKVNIASDLTIDIIDDEFCNTVEQLKENIRAGDIFQVVPSRTFSLPCVDAVAAYQALKISNPSPYMFYLKDEDFCMFGASPESAIKYSHHNRQVEIYPIAGTRPRGFMPNGKFSLDLDSRIELELRQDKKESAEHIMLVDLARNDIARVSQAGTRHVADLLKVDRYSHVMHLVSRVCGTLLPELDALHAYQACMNMGTLSGAPKVKATELIRQVEGKRRGSYGGAVGYITGEGEMDTCIVIRSAFVKNNIAQIQAGAGVVYDSDPMSEAKETRQKAQAVLSAIQAAFPTVVSSSAKIHTGSTTTQKDEK